MAGPARAWQVVLAGSSYDFVEAALSSLMMVVLATQLLGDWLRIRLDPQLRNL